MQFKYKSIEIYTYISIYNIKYIQYKSIYQLVKTKTFALYLFDMVK